MRAIRMVRDLRRLADTRFDLVIVGAGVYGALAAWDATLRGLSVALVDQGDFGAATSFNSLKTLHGGLRSLQALNLAQMRLFIRERRTWARIAPHLVQPLPFVIPTYGLFTRSALPMRIALRLNDAVAHDRHDGLSDTALYLPPGRVVSRDECLALNPVIDPGGVTGGAVWYDYQMHNSDRMTLSFVLSAADRGSVAANYVKATGLLREEGRVAGVTVRDQLTSDQFDVRSQAVLNAAGPWATSLLQTLVTGATSPAPRLSRAMNLVTRRAIPSHGCGGLARGRFLFLVPWRDRSILGTSHDVHHGDADRIAAAADDVAIFLDEAREAFPNASLTSSDVQLVHRGLLPMVSADGGQVRLLRESAVVDHKRDGVAGLISMFGVRYTTARDTAGRAIDAVFRDRGDLAFPACRTADTPVRGGAIEEKESFLRSALLTESALPQEMLRRLALTYGTTHQALVDLVQAEPDLAQPLGGQCAVSAAEIVHAVRAESAVKLSDALLRRTEAGSAGHPGSDAIERAAAVMARELAWDERRVRDEVAETEAFYGLPAE